MVTARVVIAALAAALAEASAVGLTATAAWLICRAAQQPPLSALTVAIVLVRALAIGRGGFRYAERLAGHDAVLRVMARLRGRFFDALVPLAPGGLAEFRRGDLLARLVSDVDAVQDLLVRVALPAFAALAVGGGATVWVWALEPAAGLALALGLVLAGLVLPAAATVLMARSDAKLVAAKAELAARTVDLVDGVEDLLLNGSSDLAANREHEAARSVARLDRRRAGWQAALASAGVLVQLATCAAVGWFAADTGPVVQAVLVLSTLALLEVTLPLRTAGERLGVLLAALHRVRAVLNTTAPADPADPVDPPRGPFGVELSGVDVIHPGAARPALTDVSLNVPAGTRVALVGPSGSGKSTVLGLVLRLVRPARGRVEVGGVDTAALSDAALRPRLVSGLVQDAHVFTGSIRANLLLGKENATDAELWDGLRRAGAAEWVRTLPDGLDTVITGRDVSGGERQRLALAVALLTEPAVLVLDEPTESLDPATADAVLADTVAATANRTVLLVSHRLLGLETMDRIVVLDEGRVVQCGSPDELLAAPGYYRNQYLAEVTAAQMIP